MAKEINTSNYNFFQDIAESTDRTIDDTVIVITDSTNTRRQVTRYIGKFKYRSGKKLREVPVFIKAIDGQLEDVKATIDSRIRKRKNLNK